MFFICKYCREIFSSIPLLKAHKSEVHNKDDSANREIVNMYHLSSQIKTDGSQSDANRSITDDPPQNPWWYQCPTCQTYLQNPTQFLMHIEDHLGHWKPGLFQMPNGVILDISQIKTPQIFSPKITLTPYTETIQKFKKFIPTELSVVLTVLTEEELKSIKVELAKLKLRPRSTLKKSYRVEDSIVDEEGGDDGGDTAHADHRIRNHRVKSTDRGWCPKRRNKIDVATGGTTLSRPTVAETTCPCEICGKLIRDVYGYKNHIASHKRADAKNKSKPFHCTICKVGFIRKANLVRHTFKHLDNNPFRCKICGLDAISKHHLRRHLALHFDESRIACDICGKEVARLESLRLHMKAVHYGANPKSKRKRRLNPERTHKTRLQRIPADDPPLSLSSSLSNELLLVDDCGKIKSENSKRYSEDGIPISNDDSPVSARTVADLPDSGKDSWKAEIRNKMTELHPELGVLTKHTTGGTRDAFVCQYCPFSSSFSRCFALRYHVKTCHPEEFIKENDTKDVRMICGVCGFATTEADEFSAHNETAHKRLHENRFHCTHCGIRYKSQLTLDRHVGITHTSTIRESPEYECPMCRKKYFTKAQLRQHQWNVCNPTNRPEGVKFICPLCEKECMHRNSLNAHLRLHSKERKLSVCKLCNDTCANPDSLRRHIRLVHGNGVYRRNKGRECNKTPLEPIPEDQLFL